MRWVEGVMASGAIVFHWHSCLGRSPSDECSFSLKHCVIELSMPKLNSGNAREECGAHKCRGGREEDILNNGLKVCEQRVEDVPGMGLFFLQVTATSNHMGNHMPTLHEGLKGTSPSEGFKGA